MTKKDKRKFSNKRTKVKERKKINNNNRVHE